MPSVREVKNRQEKNRKGRRKNVRQDSLVFFSLLLLPQRDSYESYSHYFIREAVINSFKLEYEISFNGTMR